jgi:hypothetical protein
MGLKAFLGWQETEGIMPRLHAIKTGRHKRPDNYTELL